MTLGEIPLGSLLVEDNMSRLRILKANNVSIKEVLEKQEVLTNIDEYKEVKENEECLFCACILANNAIG